MYKLTTAQIFSIILVVLGVLVASTGQLTDLFGPSVTKYVVSSAGMLMSILSGISAIVTGQTQQIKDVVEMAKDPTSPVQGIITTNSPEGQALAKSIPGPINTAGGAGAIELAKA
jgi:hypothetical protein